MIPFPNKKYKTIYADPPWLESGGGKIKRGADKHYSLMKTQDIKIFLFILLLMMIVGYLCGLQIIFLKMVWMLWTIGGLDILQIFFGQKIDLV